MLRTFDSLFMIMNIEVCGVECVSNDPDEDNDVKMDDTASTTKSQENWNNKNNNIKKEIWMLIWKNPIKQDTHDDDEEEDDDHEDDVYLVKYVATNQDIKIDTNKELQDKIISTKNIEI